MRRWPFDPTPKRAWRCWVSRFRRSCQNFVTYTWTGTEPPGTYVFFFLALLANALANGSVEQGEVVDLDVASFVFAPWPARLPAAPRGGDGDAPPAPDRGVLQGGIYALGAFGLSTASSAS